MPKHAHVFNQPFTPSLALAISPSDVLDFHRTQFGSLVMKDGEAGADGGDKPKGEEPKPDADDKAKGTGTDGGDPAALGDAGKRALAAERDAREKAEKDAKALREQVEGFFGGLKTLLGGEDDKGTKPDELIEQLTTKIDSLERSNLIERVARKHGITDEDDLDLLKSAKDEDAMTKLAERLAPGDGEDAGGKGKTPRSDRSQGKGGGNDSAARPKSVAEVMADRRAAREGKAKQQ